MDSAQAIAVLGVRQLRHRELQQLLTRASQHRAHRRIHAHQPQLGVGDHHADRSALEPRALVRDVQHGAAHHGNTVGTIRQPLAL